MYRTFPGVDRTMWEATIMTKILMLLWSSRLLWLPLETLPLFEAAIDVTVFFLAKGICSFDSNTFNWSSKDSGPFWDTLYRLLLIVKLDCLWKCIHNQWSAPVRDLRFIRESLYYIHNNLYLIRPIHPEVEIDTTLPSRPLTSCFGWDVFTFDMKNIEGSRLSVNAVFAVPAKQ